MFTPVSENIDSIYKYIYHSSEFVYALCYLRVLSRETKARLLERVTGSMAVNKELLELSCVSMGGSVDSRGLIQGLSGRGERPCRGHCTRGCFQSQNSGEQARCEWRLPAGLIGDDK